VVAMNLASAPLSAQGSIAEFREVHMGMEVRIAIASAEPSGRPARERAARAAFARIATLDSVLSDWFVGSELRTLHRAPMRTWIPVSPALAQVLALALTVARDSDGAFDPTVGPLTTLWRDAQRKGRPIADSARAVAMRRVGYRFVEIDTVRRRVRFARDSMQLDLGAIAKGWILDRALDELRAHGVDAALVEAGGDLTAFGAPPGTRGWRIAIPREGGDTVVVLTRGALSTSGPGEQSIARVDGTRESHVFMPRSGRGLTNSRTVTVVGASAAITDALATAITLLPARQSASLAMRYGVQVIPHQPIEHEEPESWASARVAAMHRQ
jgi:thiamine biosynthesis lipoprotein